MTMTKSLVMSLSKTIKTIHVSTSSTRTVS